jgi:hypothetical protein
MLVRYRAFFFHRWSSTTRQTHPLHGPVSQLAIQLGAPAANGVDVQARDLGQPGDTTMTELLGFQGHVPAALLFIQPTEEQIHLVMKLFVWMVAGLLAIGTLALVHIWC